MEYFLSSPDPHFWEDMHQRFVFALTEIKNRRRQQILSQRKNISGNSQVL
jgi:hypothetical protein